MVKRIIPIKLSQLYIPAITMHIFRDFRFIKYTHIFTIQVVDDRLFTGSHDGTIKVWDISGIREDAGIAKIEEDEEDEEARVILDDGYPYGDGDSYYNENGSMFLNNNPELRDTTNKDQIMDMVQTVEQPCYFLLNFSPMCAVYCLTVVFEMFYYHSFLPSVLPCSTVAIVLYQLVTMIVMVIPIGSMLYRICQLTQKRKQPSVSA